MKTGADHRTNLERGQLLDLIPTDSSEPINTHRPTDPASGPIRALLRPTPQAGPVSHYITTNRCHLQMPAPPVQGRSRGSPDCEK